MKIHVEMIMHYFIRPKFTAGIVQPLTLKRWYRWVFGFLPVEWRGNARVLVSAEDMHKVMTRVFKRPPFTF